MKIQLINFNGKNNFSNSNNEIEVNKFSEVMSPDMFDLNIIDLRSQEIYKNYFNIEYYNETHIQNDFITLNTMIENSYKSHFLFIYPQNCVFFTYYFKRDKQFLRVKRLKDIIENIKNCFSSLHIKLTSPFIFERTITELNNTKNIASDFYFPINDERALLFSKHSKKTTCYIDEQFIFTTLDIIEYSDLISFIESIKIFEHEKENVPDWMKELEFFDDREHNLEIIKHKETIKLCEEKILSSEEKLSENNRFKSILYTTGEELVEVVKNIFNQILRVDFSEFKDIKKEDLAFHFGEYTFIGEIKGVNQNIKTSNLSQLDTHFHHFIEKNSEIDPNKVRKLLIMNHQKNTPIKDRTNVDEQQISLAQEKYDILIVETIELLKMYEKFVKQELTTQECFELLCGNGILKIK